MSAADGAGQIRAIVLISVVGGAGEIGANGLISNVGGAGEIGANGLINNFAFSSVFRAKVNFFKIKIIDICPSFTLALFGQNL